MAEIETGSRLSAAVRNHLVERMRDNISLEDLNHLRLWIESNVPEGALRIPTM